MLNQTDARRLFEEAVSNPELAKKIRARLYGLIKNSDIELDDVEHTTYAKALKALPQFRGDSSMYSWFYRIATNAAYDELKERRFRRNGISLEDLRDGLTQEALIESRQFADPHKRLEAKEIASHLQKIIKSLPRRQREALMLHIEGYRVREIATQLGITQGGARCNIFWAKRFIRERM